MLSSQQWLLRLSYGPTEIRRLTAGFKEVALHRAGELGDHNHWLITLVRSGCQGPSVIWWVSAQLQVWRKE